MNIHLIISITSFLFCILMFFYCKWYIKYRTSSSKLLDEHKTESYRLIAEIDSVTDRNLLLVEDKIKTLKTILDDTDKRIAVYVKELEKSRTGEALYTSLGRGIRAALDTPAAVEPIQPAPRQASKQDFALESSPFVTPKGGPSGVPEDEPENRFSLVSPSEKRQIRAEIDALAKEGFPAGAIASRLNISLTEVEVALKILNRPSR